jgi:hypothetical protein
MPRQAIQRLEGARDRYQEWLIERKKVFNRSRRMREEDLTAELRTMASSGVWAEILGTVKLASFLREVILERRVFDESSLKLK